MQHIQKQNLSPSLFCIHLSHSVFEPCGQTARTHSSQAIKKNIRRMPQLWLANEAQEVTGFATEVCLYMFSWWITSDNHSPMIYTFRGLHFRTRFNWLSSALVIWIPIKTVSYCSQLNSFLRWGLFICITIYYALCNLSTFPLFSDVWGFRDLEIHGLALSVLTWWFVFLASNWT